MATLSANDVKLAVRDVGGIRPEQVCTAFTIVIPILTRLASGRSFYLAWGMKALIYALTDYQKKNCPAGTV